MKKIYLMSGLVILSVTSCQKELTESIPETETTPSIIEVRDSRLTFANLADFNGMVIELHELKNTASIEKVVNSKVRDKKFTSLAKFTRIRAENASKYPMAVTLEANGEDFPEIDTLVEDPFFSNLLNENREIQVGNTIYKVTPHGTFLTTVDNLEQLNDLLDGAPSAGDRQTEALAQKFYQTPVDDNLYKVNDDIYLYDTYGNGTIQREGLKPQSQRLQYFKEPDDPYGGGGGSSIGNVNTPVPEYVYRDMETYTFGAETVVGGWIEAIRGRDEVETTYFEKKRRLRVNFYDASYGVYSAVGVSVKFQKKNWIGWSGTDAHQLVIGWDFVEFQGGVIKPFTPPSTSTPSKPVYTNIPGSSKKYRLIDLRLLGRHYTYDVQQGKLVQTGIKELFDFAKKKLSNPSENVAVLTYSDIAKKLDAVLVPKDETIAYNAETMRRTFDWKTGTLILTFGAHGEIDVSGKAAKPYTINSASVYGIARYGNNWRGIRIVKPKD